jgi:uncharacterized repeat protein (TIGR03803 family)
MKTKSMMWAAAPLLIAITAVTAKAQTSAPAPGRLDPYDAISESVLWSFGGTSDDGQSPFAALIADKRGNFFGTTENGGTNNLGTVFELSPPVGRQKRWHESILWNFGANGDGVGPEAALVFDQVGNLYGTTAAGGENRSGTVYELSPPGGSQSHWRERVLWSFGQDGDGQVPQDALIIDRRGNLYGTTLNGGSNGSNGGTVFELSPPASNQPQWRESVLWSFGAAGDGVLPEGSLLADQWGNLYGTTGGGGAISFDGGTVFELSPPNGQSGAWSERVLWSFGADGDGVDPEAALIADRWGNLYGTTSNGGDNGSNGGTVFELSPPAANQTQWRESVLWSFGGGGDGQFPTASLTTTPSGSFYSTTLNGGTNNAGTVFELSPPAGTQAQWRESVLWSFGGTGDGEFPFAGLIADQSGDLYGTTYLGGANADGTVFELSLPY